MNITSIDMNKIRAWIAVDHVSSLQARNDSVSLLVPGKEIFVIIYCMPVFILLTRENSSFELNTSYFPLGSFMVRVRVTAR